MLIGITNKDAKEHGLPIQARAAAPIQLYWTFILIKNRVFRVQLYAKSYYCNEIQQHQEDKNNTNSTKSNIPLEFCIVQDVSIRSKIQTVRSKVSSIVQQGCTDVQEIKDLANNIPWKFHEFQSPKDIALKLKQEVH